MSGGQQKHSLIVYK